MDRILVYKLAHGHESIAEGLLRVSDARNYGYGMHICIQKDFYAISEY